MKKTIIFFSQTQVPIDQSIFLKRFFKWTFFQLILTFLSVLLFRILINSYSGLLPFLRPVMFLVGTLINGNHYGDVFACRFLDIYKGENKFNPMIFPLYTLMPAVNLFLFLICAFKTNKSQILKAPIFLRMSLFQFSYLYSSLHHNACFSINIPLEIHL